MTIDQALAKIKAEYEGARAKHAAMKSRHEGYAVMKEEFDELWDEVKKKKPHPDRLANEAIQVGAMALAFLLEVA